MEAQTAQFSIVDYVVFSLMLAGSLAIGLYFAFRGNKTTDDYLLASRSMSPLPVTLSLVATYFSSISILGYTGEVYGHGLQLIWIVLGIATGLVISSIAVLPVFYELNLSSINEYLELRFHSVLIRKLVLVISSLNSLVYLGVCLYAPTLALESVTPLKTSTYIIVLGLIVTLYSSFGGLKAVIWTDVLQTFIIALGIVLVTVTSISKAGGVAEVLSIAHQHGRLNATSTDFGLNERHTTINVILMGFVNFSYMYIFSQATVQRLATLRSLKVARSVMFATMAITCVFAAVLFVAGLGIFSVYAGCDPITLGRITKKDQVMPLYVMEHLGYLKGIPGLLVACLFSGTLSSISSILSSLPTMLWMDFLSEIQILQTASERVKIIMTKLLTLLIGILMIFLATLCSHLDGLIQSAVTILSVISGPVMGVFVLGVAVPICGKKGALAGLCVSFAVMCWISIGAQLHGPKTQMLPLSIDSCSNSTLSAHLAEQFLHPQTNATATSVTSEPPDRQHALAVVYNISYTLYAAIGLMICLIVGIIVTLVTGKEDLQTVKPEHVIYSLRRFLGPRQPQQEAELARIVAKHSNIIH